jgi:hypothetical protein
MESVELQKHDHHIYQSLVFEFLRGNPQYSIHEKNIAPQAYSLFDG